MKRIDLEKVTDRMLRGYLDENGKVKVGLLSKKVMIKADGNKMLNNPAYANRVKDVVGNIRNGKMSIVFKEEETDTTIDKLEYEIKAMLRVSSAVVTPTARE